MNIHLLACPFCAYSRWMPVWALFAVLRVLVLVLVVGKKLDLVRIALLFSGVELVCYWLAGQAIMHGGPGNESNWPFVLHILLLAYSTGLPVAVFLKMFSHHAYFRPHPPHLGWRECFNIVPAWILLFAAQIVWGNAR